MSEQRTILIVDDDADDLDLLRSAFLAHDRSLRIVTARNGQDAINLLEREKANRPWLMVIDYEMPVLNGLQTLCRLASQQEHSVLVKIVWSTVQSGRLIKESYLHGARRWMQKPDTLEKAHALALEMLLLST